MREEGFILMELVSKALQGKSVEMPDNVDVNELTRLAKENMMANLVIDESVAKMENKHRYYMMALQTVCGLFRDEGLRPMVLKGISMAENYPEPLRRGLGDVDLYVMDENGKNAASRGDKILSCKLGLVSVDENGENHHSAFKFGRLSIENHYTLVGLDNEGPRFAVLRERLAALAAESCKGMSEKEYYCFPSANFNAVFLVWHTYCHFPNKTSQSSLRQFADWTIFLRKNYYKVDWDMVEEVWRECGLSKFAKAMNGFVVRYLGCEERFCKGMNRDANAMERFAERVLYPVDYGGSMASRGMWYYHNRWCLEFVYGKRWWRQLAEFVCRFVRQNRGNVIKEARRRVNQ